MSNRAAAVRQGHKVGRLARAVVDARTITTDDIADGILEQAGVRSALLRSVLYREQDDRRVIRKTIGSQRWITAGEDTWTMVAQVATAMLED